MRVSPGLSVAGGAAFAPLYYRAVNLWYTGIGLGQWPVGAPR